MTHDANQNDYYYNNPKKYKSENKKNIVKVQG